MKWLLCSVKSALCQPFSLKSNEVRETLVIFAPQPSLTGELSLPRYNHHYFCHDFMASAWFIIFREIFVVKGQW